MVSTGAAFSEEVAHRVAAGRQAAAALSASVFANRRIPTRLRTLIASACVHNRLLFSAGTWGPLRPAAMRRLAVPFHSPLRRTALRGRFAVDDPDSAVTNPGVLAMLRLPGLQSVLWAAKLRLRPRLLHSAPPATLAAVQSPGGAEWRKDLTAAATFLRHLLPTKLSALPDPSADMRPWESLAPGFPKAWSALIRRGLAAASEDPQLEAAALASSRACSGLAPVARDPALGASDHDNEGFLCACGHVATTRLLHHLEFGARRCRSAFAAGQLPALSPDAAAAAAATDATLRREARAAGRSLTSRPPCRRFHALPRAAAPASLARAAVDGAVP